jgi:hypothetical protein
MYRLAICLSLGFVSPAVAQEVPPGDALPLSQMLKTVEADGARTVHSAEWHRRAWEVVSCPGRSRVCTEQVIDARTGSVLSSDTEGVGILPPEGAMAASAIAAQVEALDLGQITDLEFDDRRWEIEVRNGIRRAEFRLDPMTGAGQRCEGTLCP